MDAAEGIEVITGVEDDIVWNIICESDEEETGIPESQFIRDLSNNFPEIDPIVWDIVFESDEEENSRILRPRFIRARLEHFSEMDDFDFVRRFRLSKENCVKLLELIDWKLEYSSDRNHAVSPINQLLLCLRFYATGCTQLSASHFSGVSEATAYRAIHRVTAAIASLYKDFIYFPRTDDEIHKTQSEFYRIARFPRVIGAIDCTHIKIRSPGGKHAEYYRNRKGYFSLNCQGICNANMEFLNIVARWPGSNHNQTIFDHSLQRVKFENNEYNDALLVGDSSYSCRRYLMPPLDNPQTPEEILYNESQIRTRNPIERIFGVWKRRFPVLALGINVHLEKAMPIIVACAVLFNMLRRAGEPEPPSDPTVQLPMPWQNLLEQGQITNVNPLQQNVSEQTRQCLINDYFKTLYYSNTKYSNSDI